MRADRLQTREIEQLFRGAAKLVGRLRLERVGSAVERDRRLIAIKPVTDDSQQSRDRIPEPPISAHCH